MALQTHEAVDLGVSLARALSYVKTWKGKSVVVKFGGSVLAGEDQGTLIEDLVLLKGAGVDPVLVHGGGPEITRLLERLGMESRFVNGLRVTDGETMEVVEMVLGGRTNKAIVSMLARAGGRAVGVSGKDGKVFQARRLAAHHRGRRLPRDDPEGAGLSRRARRRRPHGAHHRRGTPSRPARRVVHGGGRRHDARSRSAEGWRRTTMNTQTALELSERYLMTTYRRIPVAFAHGQGVRLTDLEGKQYLDFIAGIAVSALGHNHPAVTAAIQAQAARLLHVSNFYLVPEQAILAQWLAAHSACARAFFCNSGAEANEAAIKLTRKYWRKKGASRYEIIVAQGSFHGRTLAALAATSQPKYQQDFQPLPPGFVTVPFNDLGALRGAVTANTAAVMF